MERIKTHIKGFDKLIGGGFPKGSNILLTGVAGTGKTIFSLEYLYNGVIKENEFGIYFSFEEKKESLFQQAKQFGWDLEKLENESKLKIIPIGSEDINKSTLNDIVSIIESSKVKRIVIDSITTLSYLVPQSQDNGIINQYTIKKFLYSFLTKLNQISELTSIIISQKDEKISNSISEYLCDGIINIEYESLGGDFSRNLTINKMRKTKNDEDLHPMEIGNGGIIVHNLE